MVSYQDQLHLMGAS